MIETLSNIYNDKKTLSAKELYHCVLQEGMSAPDVEIPAPTLPQALAQNLINAEGVIWLVCGDQSLANLPHLAKFCHKVSKIVIILQPDSLKWLKISDLQAIQNDLRFHFLPDADPASMASMIVSSMDLQAYQCWKPVLLPIQDIQIIKKYRVLFQELASPLNRKVVSYATAVNSSHMFILNALINAPLTGRDHGFINLKGSHRGKPVLIVATGPSLNKQLEKIARYRDYFLILAVDPAVPILKTVGVDPDYVFSIDPRKRPYWSQDELADDTTFVIDVGCCADGAWSSTKKYLFTSCHQQVYALLNHWGANLHYLETGGSVSTNAFSFALHLDANPIVLVGQDLAWTDGKDHADGYVSQYSQEKLKRRSELGYDIKGFNGETVRTERQLLYYKEWFERKIKENPDRMIINATEGGALIEGAMHLPFLDVCEDVVKKGVNQSLPEISQWVPEKIFLENYKKSLSKIIDDYKNLNTELEECIKKIEKIKGIPKISLHKKVDLCNSLIKGMDPEAKIILEMCSQMAMAGTEKRLTKLNDASTLKEIFKYYKDVYQSTIFGLQIAKKILPNIINLIENIQNGEKISRELLIKNHLNRWSLDGFQTGPLR